MIKAVILMVVYIGIFTKQNNVKIGNTGIFYFFLPYSKKNKKANVRK